MTEEKCNGWTNRETWLIALWIDNDQGSQEYWLKEAGDAMDDTNAEQSHAIRILADRLKDEHTLDAEHVEITGVYADLMNYALAGVNWYEIAEHLIESAKEQAESSAE